MSVTDNLDPIGGDFAGYECSECDSDNTEFEEYTSNGDNSELGIKCQDCGHEQEPEDFNQRFEPDEE